MLDPQCPACKNTNDFNVIGLEDGKIRLHCSQCLHDFFAEEGPHLRPCGWILEEGWGCPNWIPDGVTSCSKHQAVVDALKEKRHASQS